jgi:hypothetical protein
MLAEADSRVNSVKLSTFSRITAVQRNVGRLKTVFLGETGPRLLFGEAQAVCYKYIAVIVRGIRAIYKFSCSRN